MKGFAFKKSSCFMKDFCFMKTASIIKRYLVIIALVSLLVSCQQQQVAAIKEDELLYNCEQQLTNVIVHDINSPPVAARMYTYSNLAFYEALRPSYPKAISFLPILKGFEQISLDRDVKNIHYPFAAAMAFMNVAETLVFSKDSIRVAKDSLQIQFDGLASDVKEQSTAWANQVSSVILKRAAEDGYKLTRGMPKFSVFKERGIWQQTPPDYEEAIEPNWRYIKPLLMDSASQFKPARPPAYNLNKNSQYFKELNELYQMSVTLTDEQKQIAKFWDDNPFVSEHRGHFTYATKKTTPVGHWMGIIGILGKQSKLPPIEIAKAYAMASAAVFDGFISTWEEKFTSKTVRPITVIRENIASEWNAFLQTPPFPEYTSGHSVISAAAATVLSSIFGNQTPFRDTVELKYLGMERSFPSINAAANEVSISRMYGGIHYRSAVENGQKQGQAIGNYFIQKLQK